jgi:hypothetical protein
MKKVKVTVFYSPQPDEPQSSSASYEYAKRIKELHERQHDEHDQNMNITVNINRLSMESIGIISSDDKEAEEDQLCIFIISCSADGSVDRIVRNLVRSMKNSETTGEKKTATTNSEDEKDPKKQKLYCAIALLGHARCENSAQQMKDTIFSNGRKFYQAIMRKSLKEGVSANARKLEIQAELEGPDTPFGFDEWIGDCLRLVKGSC